MDRIFKPGMKLQLKGIQGTYIIRDLIGRGSSCVVYHADFYNGFGAKSEHFLKEFNPKNIDITRTDDLRLRVCANEVYYFEAEKQRFKEGYKKQASLHEKSGLKNYTANIQNVYEDYNTVYIDMNVTEGKPYDAVCEKSIYDLARRMKVLAEVVGKYHENGYLHLDLKPNNIYVRPETETSEDVLLFDFDSVTEKCNLQVDGVVSYTREWAALELISASRRHLICEATDIFSIGEIFFVKLMGRHSESWERRTFSKYDYDFQSPVFGNLNPKIIPLLDTLFHHTICHNLKERYQSTDKLVQLFEKIIKMYNQEEPFYLKKLFYDCRDLKISFDLNEIKSKLGQIHCASEWEYMNSMDKKMMTAIIEMFLPQSKIVQKFVTDYSEVFDSLRDRLLLEIDDAQIKSNIREMILKTQSNFLNGFKNMLDFGKIQKIIVDVQDEKPKKVKHLNLCKVRKFNARGAFWNRLCSEVEKIIDPQLETLYAIPLQCELRLLEQIKMVLKENEHTIRKEYLNTIQGLFENIKCFLKNSFINEQSIYQKALYFLYSENKSLYNEGLNLLFRAYDEKPTKEIADEINRHLPLYNGTPLEYIDNKVFFIREEVIYNTYYNCFGVYSVDGMETILFEFGGGYSYRILKKNCKLYILTDYDEIVSWYSYDPNINEMQFIASHKISVFFGELVLIQLDKYTLQWGKKSKWKQFEDDENNLYIAQINN